MVGLVIDDSANPNPMTVHAKPDSQPIYDPRSIFEYSKLIAELTCQSPGTRRAAKRNVSTHITDLLARQANYVNFFIALALDRGSRRVPLRSSSAPSILYGTGWHGKAWFRPAFSDRETRRNRPSSKLRDDSKIARRRAPSPYPRPNLRGLNRKPPNAGIFFRPLIIPQIPRGQTRGNLKVSQGRPEHSNQQRPPPEPAIESFRLTRSPPSLFERSPLTVVDIGTH